MVKVFITGGTGFLGSNIAYVLTNSGHSVMAVYRNSSSIKISWWQINNVNWILQDQDWESKVIAFEPDVIIHAAWLGVDHVERNTWQSQFANIEYLSNLLIIAQKANVRKFIGLGSQAEYGNFDGCVTEDEALNPTTPYGCVKIVCSELIRHFCNTNEIEWFWLRLFSFFGKGESANWLIPSLISKLLTVDEMDFTPGEQRYAYLYAEDLGRAVNTIIKKDGRSGIYNISAKNPLKIKRFNF
jgi:nucleoside-diphosphate-sugar epimerase